MFRACLLALAGVPVIVAAEPATHSNYADTLTVGVCEDTRKPGWKFHVEFSVNEKNEATLKITDRLATFTPDDFLLPASFQDGEKEPVVSYVFKDRQQHLIFVKPWEKPRQHTGNVKKYDGGWVSLNNVKFHDAWVEFYLYERCDSAKRAVLEPVRDKDGVVIGMRAVSGVTSPGKGSIQLTLSKSNVSSMVRVTFGAATSGEENGNGASVEGDWHHPKGSNEKGYSDLFIKPTSIKESNPEVAWSLKWTRRGEVQVGANQLK